MVQRSRSDDAMSLEEAAEAAVNQGDLPRAVALYERIVVEAPSNELAKERLAELKAADARARDHRMATAARDAERAPTSNGAFAHASSTPSSPVSSTMTSSAPLDSDGKIVFLEGLLQQVEERRRRL